MENVFATVRYNEKGILELDSFTVDVNYGNYPNNIGGRVTLTNDDGVTLETKKDDVIKKAQEKVLQLFNESIEYKGEKIAHERETKE